MSRWQRCRRRPVWTSPPHCIIVIAAKISMTIIDGQILNYHKPTNIKHVADGRPSSTRVNTSWPKGTTVLWNGGGRTLNRNVYIIIIYLKKIILQEKKRKCPVTMGENVVFIILYLHIEVMNIVWFLNSERDNLSLYYTYIMYIYIIDDGD